MNRNVGPYKIASTLVSIVFFILMFLMFMGTIEMSPVMLFAGAPVFIVLWLVLEHLSSKRKRKKQPEEYEDTEGSFWKSPEGGISAKGLAVLIMVVIGVMMVFVFVSSP